jgi:DNA-binding Lrp family transcriptional regulator
MAVFMIDASPSSTSGKRSTSYDSSTILKELAKTPNVIAARKTVGDHDLFAIVAMKDFEHLKRVRDDITRIPGVKDLQVSFWTGVTELPGFHNYQQFCLNSKPKGPR